MRKPFSKFALAASIALALALTLSCGEHSSDGGGGSGGSTAITKEIITGTAQKGPFAKGATVKIYELDSKFEKTKAPYEGKTIDDMGNFAVEIAGGKLASPYIVIEVTGRYTNEVTGQLSDADITLNATSDVSAKSNVNVNVLTHLEQDKVLTLAKSGKSFDEAKQQAQGEVLSALGISASGFKSSEDIDIFGSGSSDSVLLSVSVLLQGNRSTAEVFSLLANLSGEIKNSGTISSATQAEVANGLVGVDLDQVKDNILSLDQDAKVPDEGPIFVPSSSSIVSSSSGTTPSNGLYCKRLGSSCPNDCCLLDNPNAKDLDIPTMTYRETCVEYSEGIFNNAACTGTPVAGGGAFSGEYCRWDTGCARLTKPNDKDPNNPTMTNKDVCKEWSLGVFSNLSSCASASPAGYFNGEYCKWDTGCYKINWPNEKTKDDPTLTNRESCILYSDGVFTNATCTGTPVAGGPFTGEYCKWEEGGECYKLANPNGASKDAPGLTNRQNCVENSNYGVFDNATCTGKPVAGGDGEFCQWEGGCYKISNPNAANSDDPNYTNREMCIEWSVGGVFSDPACKNLVAGGGAGEFCKWEEGECSRISNPGEASKDAPGLTNRENCIEWSYGLFTNPTCSGTPIAGGNPEFCKYKPGLVDCPNDCCRLPTNSNEKTQEGLTMKEDCIGHQNGVYNNSTCTGTPIAPPVPIIEYFCKFKPGIVECPYNCCREFDLNEITPEEGLTRKEVCVGYQEGIYDNPTCSGTPVAPPVPRQPPQIIEYYCKHGPGEVDCPNDCCYINPNDKTPLRDDLTVGESCIQYALGIFNNPQCR